MKYRIAVAVGAAILVVAVAMVVHSPSTPSNTPHNPGAGYDPAADLNFFGTVGGGGGITLNGSLTVDIRDMDRDGFPNVSYRLYDANGTLLGGGCVGRLVIGERTTLDVHHTVRPRYVVFSSPVFWPDTGEEYGTIADYYEFRDGQYRIRSALRPSSYPIDIEQHDPCS